MIYATEDETLGVMPLNGVDMNGWQHALILKDYKKWGPLQDTLDEWLEDKDAERIGMVLYYNDTGFYTVFKLRWT